MLTFFVVGRDGVEEWLHALPSKVRRFGSDYDAVQHWRGTKMVRVSKCVSCGPRHEVSSGSACRSDTPRRRTGESTAPSCMTCFFQPSGRRPAPGQPASRRPHSQNNIERKVLGRCLRHSRFHPRVPWHPPSDQPLQPSQKSQRCSRYLGQPQT